MPQPAPVEPAPEASAEPAPQAVEAEVADAESEQPVSHRAALEAQLRKELGLVREGKADGAKDFTSLFAKKRK